MKTAMFISDTLKIGDASVDEVVRILENRYQFRFLDNELDIPYQMRDVSVVVDWQANPPSTLLDFASQIKLWQFLCIGTERFDFDGWRQTPTSFELCPSSTSGHALGEAAIMMTLMLLRRTNESRLSIQERRLSYPPGEELSGKSLLLYGFGASGKALAGLVKPFGVKIRAIDVRPVPESELAEVGIFEPVYSPDRLQEMAAWCDILSIHVPVTPETENSINNEVLEKMKPGSYLINVSRGAILDEEALLNALNSGILAGAALDVVKSEPVDPSNPILSHPNVVMTPHVAVNTRHVAIRRAEALRANLIKYGLY
jgi:phosphoglycerate dehydrogenase-like enzyme